VEKIDAQIRLYVDEDGTLVDQKNGIDVDRQLGGMVPHVGDLIVEPAYLLPQSRRSSRRS